MTTWPALTSARWKVAGRAIQKRGAAQAKFINLKLSATGPTANPAALA